MVKPKERLSTYRKKRDFTITSEPSGDATDDATGTAPPETSGNRFVVQRHRASRLHYDFRLEAAGVLVSWAVPKGPTLDPKTRRMAVHVEDHPIEYFDFEGVIPRGEYGGGDVIVWDWGTWTPDDKYAKDPIAAIDKGEIHFDVEGEKLHGRFVLVRDKRDSSGKQWLLLHKRDDHAVPGWDPEEHPTSVKSGRTNDEVLEARDAEWTRDIETRAPWAHAGPWPAASAEELKELGALKKEGLWTLGGLELKLTNLDKVLFPAKGRRKPVTKRDLIRYHALIAPHMLPYFIDRPVNTHRYPNGVDKPGFWYKQLPDFAPEWIRRWHNPEAAPDETQVYAVLDSPASLAWMANYGSVELHPWTSRIEDVHRPTWAFIDIDPGPASTFDDVLTLARLYRAALDHLGVTGVPKVTGQRGVQIWVPIADRYTFDDTRPWVEGISRAIGRTVPELVSWSWTKSGRKGLARLDYKQNAINKT